MLLYRKWLVVAAAATATVACDQSPTAVPADDFGPAAVVVPEDHAAAFQVTVCKEGPAGTSSFSVTANTGSVNLPFGGTFTLDPDECKTVATTTGAVQSVTVVETFPAPGSVFSEVEVWEFFTGTQATTLDRTETDPEVTVSPFGNDRGVVVVFKNIPETPSGCTLTQGYWKEHSEYGPSPFDATWNLLANGADTPFFGSGQTWYQVFQTDVNGNAYYNLAHQYMAAVLNGLAGASAPQAVIDAIADAEALFGAFNPADIAAMKGSNPVRQQFIALAGTLDQYNRGLIGPGRCTG